MAAKLSVMVFPIGLVLLMTIVSFTAASASLHATNNSMQVAAHLEKKLIGNSVRSGDNETDLDKDHAISVASLHYDYVQNPLLITVFLLSICIIKIGKYFW